jgi:HSP20 family molecular chaperone IbpA
MNHKTFRPQADIWETPTDLHISVEVPGATVENTSVEFKEGELRLHVSVPQRNYASKAVLIQEYEVGDYERIFRFEPTLLGQDVDAELNNGLLHVRLPKASPKISRKIDVRAN